MAEPAGFYKPQLSYPTRLLRYKKHIAWAVVADLLSCGAYILVKEYPVSVSTFECLHFALIGVARLQMVFIY